MPVDASPPAVKGSRPRRIARNVRLTLRLAWQAARPQMSWVIALTVVTAVITPVQLLATGKLIDGIAAHPTSWRDDVVFWPVLALGALAVINQTLQALIGRVHDVFSDRVWLAAHKNFLRHVAAADIALLDDPAWHDKLTRARADVGWRPYNLTLTLIHIFSSTITLITLCTALFVLDPRLVPLGVLSVLPAALMKLRTNERFYKLFWQTTRREREHDYMVTIASDPRFAKDMRAFGLGDHVVERARALSLNRLEQKRSLYKSANYRDLIGGLGSAALLLVAYAFIVDAGARGTVTVGQVAAIFGAFTSLTAHLGATLGALVTVDQHAQFLDDYFSFLAITPSITAPPAGKLKALPARITRVSLERATFRYGGEGKTPALVDVDLEVKAGQIVAVVGENGAGKSTLVKLLLRFFDPHSGCVRFDGVDARELDPGALRERVGVLFQDYGAYELEVQDVLRFGRINLPFDRPRAEQALRAARADVVVQEIGNGLQSVVGRLFEGGHDLSGGQWQRLALARLIYRDADLWILDEPTANLDPEAEAEIFAELRTLLQGRMGIVISHRFSTVRSADQIVVLAGGRVVERGTHEELVALQGRYAQMFDLQARGYR